MYNQPRLETYAVRTGERLFKFPGREKVKIEAPLIKDVKNDIVQRNLQMLTGKEWDKAWPRESMGGNAGKGNLCVNAMVNRNTGEIIAFTNYPKDLTENGNVSFLAAVFGSSGTVTLFIDKIYFEGDFSENAKQNIASAIELKNSR